MTVNRRFPRQLYEHNILIQLFKETPVNCHSALDAESSVFKHSNVRESKSLDPASERGVTRRPFLE